MVIEKMDLAAKYGMNRLIDSRKCYELIQRGYVSSEKANSSNHEHIRTIEELVSNDRGGMIISPQTGLHENVIVLDYDNEYANLIVNYNLSYETVSPDEKTRREGANKELLPTVVEKFLNQVDFIQRAKNIFGVNNALIHSRIYLCAFTEHLVLFGIGMVMLGYLRK